MRRRNRREAELNPLDVLAFRRAVRKGDTHALESMANVFGLASVGELEASVEAFAAIPRKASRREIFDEEN